MSHGDDVVNDLISDKGLGDEHQNDHEAAGGHGGPSNALIISSAILFMIGLLVINELMINWLKKAQRSTGGIFKLLNNTMITTAIGLLAGCLLKYGIAGGEKDSDSLKDSFEDIFLLILLPPIIFEGAVNMDGESFFKHLGTIATYALPGTAIATSITAYLLYHLDWFGVHLGMPLIECIAFGSLISATDPVAVINIFKSLNANKMLFIIIFGESILNDAIAIIFYETTVEIYHQVDITFGQGVNTFIYMLGGSIIVGFLIGLICALILKSEKRSASEHIDNVETIIVVTIPWASYLVAFHLKLSGIVSVMFCGIAMGNYVMPNLSPQGQHLMHLFYHALGYCFESLTFIFIGIVFVVYGIAWDMLTVRLFIAVSFILVFARFVNVAVITLISNQYRNKNRLSFKHFLVLWYSGFRGAMATALSLSAVATFKTGRFGELFLILTLLTAGINIFVQGFFLIPLMEVCGVIGQSGDGDEYNILEEPNESRIKQFFQAIDRQFIQRFFVIQNKDGDHDDNEIELQQKSHHH